jgi:hypothetical protein
MSFIWVHARARVIHYQSYVDARLRIKTVVVGPSATTHGSDVINMMDVLVLGPSKYVAGHSRT